MTQSCSKSTIVPSYLPLLCVAIQMQTYARREIQIQWRTNTRDLVARLPPSVTVGVPDPPPHPVASLQYLCWPSTSTTEILGHQYHATLYQYHRNTRPPIPCNTIPVPSEYHANTMLCYLHQDSYSSSGTEPGVGSLLQPPAKLSLSTSLGDLSSFYQKKC